MGGVVDSISDVFSTANDVVSGMLENPIKALPAVALAVATDGMSLGADAAIEGAALAGEAITAGELAGMATLGATGEGLSLAAGASGIGSGLTFAGADIAATGFAGASSLGSGLSMGSAFGIGDALSFTGAGIYASADAINALNTSLTAQEIAQGVKYVSNANGIAQKVMSIGQTATAANLAPTISTAKTAGSLASIPNLNTAQGITGAQVNATNAALEKAAQEAAQQTAVNTPFDTNSMMAIVAIGGILFLFKGQ